MKRHRAHPVRALYARAVGGFTHHARHFEAVFVHAGDVFDGLHRVDVGDEELGNPLTAE